MLLERSWLGLTRHSLCSDLEVSPEDRIGFADSVQTQSLRNASGWRGAELISLLASKEGYALGRWNSFVPGETLFLGKCEKGRGPCRKRPSLVLVPGLIDSSEASCYFGKMHCLL